MSSCQLVVFSLGNEEYAIEISCAQEIIRIPELTKLPNVPDYIEGIINLRDKIIPIFDLKKRFGIGQTDRGNDTRLLILDLDGMKVGVIVDDVSEVMRVNEEAFQSLSNEVISISKNSIDRVAILDQRIIIILNALKFKEEICKYNLQKEQVK